MSTRGERGNLVEIAIGVGVQILNLLVLIPSQNILLTRRIAPRIFGVHGVLKYSKSLQNLP